MQFFNRNVKEAILIAALPLDPKMVAKLAWITGTNINDVTTEGEVWAEKPRVGGYPKGE